MMNRGVYVKYILLILISFAGASEYNSCKYALSGYWKNHVFPKNSTKVDSILFFVGSEVRAKTNFSYWSDSIIYNHSQYTSSDWSEPDTNRLTLLDGKVGGDSYQFLFDTLYYGDFRVDSVLIQGDMRITKYLDDSLLTHRDLGVFSDDTMFSAIYNPDLQERKCVEVNNVCSCDVAENGDSLKIVIENGSWNEQIFRADTVYWQTTFYLKEDQPVSVVDKTFRNDLSYYISGSELYFEYPIAVDVYSHSGKLVYSSKSKVQLISLDMLPKGSFLIQAKYKRLSIVLNN